MLVVELHLTDKRYDEEVGEEVWEVLHSLPLETSTTTDSFSAVREQVQRFIEGEGQGSFVVETEGGWCCVPTRSIRYMRVVDLEDVDAG